MKGNAGLASRMPYIIEFPNYTREQLADIFMSMARKNFACDEALEGAVREYFDSLSEEVYAAKEFSNARYVRNLFERTWGKAAMRTQMQKLGEITLTAEDFATAGGEGEFSKTLDKPKRALGFAAV